MGEKRASIAVVITSCLSVKCLSRFEPTSGKSSVIYFYCCSLTLSIETLSFWSFSVFCNFFLFLEELRLLQVGVYKLVLWRYHVCMCLSACLLCDVNLAIIFVNVTYIRD